MIKRYNNYHRHSMYSNLRSIDCVVKPIEYIERAKELDEDKAIYFTTEHGFQGNIYEAYTLCKQNNVKMIVGSEVYYVENRKEKDKSNYHMVIIAKNEDGRKDLNRILSYANEDGYYYKPRIDDELLFSINPNNVIITTACVASRLRKDEGAEEWLTKMKSFFGNNLFLEVQSHNHIKQIEYNKKMITYSNKLNIPIIHGNDSHYIYKEDAKYRDLFLKAKGIVYEDEEGFVLDYPTYDEIIERYILQGVLTEEQINQALNNTLIFDNFEGIVINDDIKMPKISNNPTSELKGIINEEWKKELPYIDINRKNEYLTEIRNEMQIIEDTHMEQYFILNYKIVKKATKEYDGVLSKTGRGSCPSFYVNKLLRFTDIDRLTSQVKLHPSRFMSTVRILESRSLP